MRIQDVVALKANQRILVRVKAIGDDDVVLAELVDAPGLSLSIPMYKLIELGANEPKDELEGSVNILGTEYQIKLFTEEEKSSEWGDGYTDFSTKEIYLLSLKQCEGSMKDLKWYQKLILRHEIVHAFLFESGLNASSHLAPIAVDEELVDWIAIQSPKIWKAFEEAGCNE